MSYKFADGIEKKEQEPSEQHGPFKTVTMKKLFKSVVLILVTLTMSGDIYKSPKKYYFLSL